MKKILLIAGAAFVMASCNSNEATTTAASADENATVAGQSAVQDDELPVPKTTPHW
jgi:PBP1b-binding outer membrane lipoprotein LpoB